MEDWYSGTLPYAVTARAGSGRAVRRRSFFEGVDRVALRADGAATWSRPTSTAGRSGSARPADGTVRPLRLGRRVRTRCAPSANGRYLSVDDDGVLVNDQPGPNGWEVRQTFRMEERPRGDAGAAAHLHRPLRRRWTTTAAPAGRRRRRGRLADRGAVVESGAEAAAALAADGGRGRRGASATTRWSTAGRPRTAPTWRCPPPRSAVLRAVRAANPRTVLVISSGYPSRHLGGRAPARRCCGPSHGGQEYGHALADVLFGDADPGGPAHPDLVPLGAASCPTCSTTTSSPPTPPTSTTGAPRSTRSATASATPTFDYARPAAGATLSTATRSPPGRGHQHRRPRRAWRSCSSTPTSGAPGSSSRCAGCAASHGSRSPPARARTVRLDLRRRPTWPSGTSPGAGSSSRTPRTSSWSAAPPRDIRPARRFRVGARRIPPARARAAAVAAVDHDEYDAVSPWCDAARDARRRGRAPTEARRLDPASADVDLGARARRPPGRRAGRHRHARAA